MTDEFEDRDDDTDEVSQTDEEIARELIRQAREQGVSLVGPGGLLSRLTKKVLESALNAEMTEHLGYEKHASSKFTAYSDETASEHLSRGATARTHSVRLTSSAEQ
jgi:transposase-like protein